MSSPIESAERTGSAHPLRAISFGDPAVTVDRRDDGTIYLRPKAKLRDYPVRLTDRLHHWAREAPERVFMAERDAAGGWRKITYAQLLATTRRIASALLARGLSAEKPIVILSGNSIDHALLAFGALYAGIPFCPVSPAYSLVSRDYGKLAYLMKLLTPGLVFADDAAQIRRCAVSQCFAGDGDRGVARRRARPQRDAAVGPDGDAGASAPRCGARRHRPGHDRKVPADLGLDRQSQGRHQHPADDLRQPGDAARDAGVPDGRAARHRRLAAVESHLWRQPQYRADAVQWRLDVSRRGQADARRHRGDRAQSPRDFADGLFQRAERL